MTRACETCEWWVLLGNREGQCRGAPPTPITASGTVAHGRGVWPETYHNDWCAAWKLAERLAGGRDVRKTT